MLGEPSSLGVWRRECATARIVEMHSLTSREIGTWMTEVVNHVQPSNHAVGVPTTALSASASSGTYRKIEIESYQKLKA